MSTRALAWLGLVALTALPASGITNEITGFNKAKFGSSIEAAKKVYPKMEPLTENLGATAFPSEHLARFVIRGAPVDELKKSTDVELRFWKGKLWAYIVYYGDGNAAVIIEALTKRLGPPNGSNPEKPGWLGETSMTFVETSAHWYSVTDNGLSKDAQAWFTEKLKGGGIPVGAVPAPTTAAPAAAPPAATPPVAAPSK
jgi:hypothetical protein